jgi:hypothetical protein
MRDIYFEYHQFPTTSERLNAVLPDHQEIPDLTPHLPIPNAQLGTKGPTRCGKGHGGNC